MRRRALTLLAVILLVLVGIPVAVVRRGGERGRWPARAGAPTAMAVTPGFPEVSLYDSATGKVLRLPLEEYVAGVVAAEMPASFHPEALKAQAVAARTYAVLHVRAFGGEGCRSHPEADLCSDPREGQAWMLVDRLRRQWGRQFETNWSRVREAVAATRGLIAVFRNRPIEAVYHAASGGVTEDAVAVWGRAVPYLRSVSSPFEAGTRHDRVAVTMTVAEAARRTGVSLASLRRTTAAGVAPVAVAARTASGRVAVLRVGDRRLTGEEARAALGLRSTLFTVRVSGDALVVESRGYGHGVGLSQYGADGLARRGYDFRRILAHFYQGTTVRPLFYE